MTPQKKRILYALIFGVLLLLIPIGYFAFKYVQDARSSASVDAPPKNIQVVNTLSNSFDIIWTTDTPATGKVKYGTNPNNLPNEAYDIRGNTYKGTSHVISVKSLDPKVKYYYQIISNENATSVKESVTTFDVVSTEPINIFGSLDGNSDKLIVVKLIEKGSASAVQATQLGTAIVDNGSWTVDGGNFRTDTGAKISSFNNYLLHVEALDKDGVVVARVVTPEITTATAITMSAGQVDDPVKIASQYTDPTTRVTDTPTPTVSITPSCENGSCTTNTPTISQTPTTVPNIGAIKVSNTKIVNLLDGTFAVTWETDKPVNSYVQYTINGSNPTKAFDKRSNEKLARSLRTHFVEISDTTNPAGTSYEITLINNGVPHTIKLTHTKINITEVPSVESLAVKFKKTGNYIDQMLFAEIPGKTTKIAIPPSILATGILDLSALRKVEKPTDKYTLLDSDTLTFTLAGGKLNNQTTLSSKTVGELKAMTTGIDIDSTPTDTTPFTIIYINIKNGEVLKTQTPNFFGEGLQPNSDLTIEIQKK